MPSREFLFSFVSLLPIGPRRAIGFLEDRNDPRMDARATFATLSGNRERTVRHKFGYWQEGGQPHDKWFHGWPSNPKYKDCFVFKWDEQRLHHRLYGFLCNPSATQPRLRVCALMYHDAKTDWETDYSILDRINTARQNQLSFAAIIKSLPR
jgi:hypothetical protein